MDEILAGVRAFQREVYPQYRDLFERLAAGQSPKALFVTCSDSRVDPLLVTQSPPGELFVLRNAGNLVPPYDGPGGGVAATVEFAVIALRVKHIIICGHSGCGAMAGLLDPRLTHRMPRIVEWLQHARVVRDSLAAAGQLDAPDALRRAVEANVIAQLGHLRTHPSVSEALEAGQLKLHGWVYHLATGDVETYDSAQGQFRLL